MLGVVTPYAVSRVRVELLPAMVPTLLPLVGVGDLSPAHEAFQLIRHPSTLQEQRLLPRHRKLVVFHAVEQVTGGVLPDADHGGFATLHYDTIRYMENQLIYAYLAGTIDADGCITVQRVKKLSKRCKRLSTYYIIKIALNETSPVVPTLLKETFGGQLYTHQPANQSHKRWYIWQVTNQLAISAIRLLMPYLRLKKEQAEIAVKFGAVLEEQWLEIRSTQKPPYRITDEHNAVRHSFWAVVTKLNAPRNRRVHFVETPELETPPASLADSVHSCHDSPTLAQEPNLLVS